MPEARDTPHEDPLLRRARGRKEEALGHSGRAVSGLGLVVRAWRRWRGLSVTALAVRAGFGQSGRSYISKIEHGIIDHVADERLDRIAAALGVSRIDLLLRRLPSGETLDVAAAERSPLLLPQRIDEWSVVDGVRRGSAGGPPAGRPWSLMSDYEGMLDHDHGFVAEQADRDDQRGPAGADGSVSSVDAPPARLEQEGRVRQIPPSLEVLVQRAVDAVVERLEASVLALLRRNIEKEIQPVLVRLILDEIAAARASGSGRVAADFTPQADHMQTSAANAAGVLPAQSVIFAGVLSDILQRHGRQWKSLYAVRVGDGRIRIHPRQIQRLKRAAAGDCSCSVTLNPDEIAAIEHAFSLDDQDQRRLRAALLAESVYRVLVDHIGTEEALRIGRAVLQDLLDSQRLYEVADSSDSVLQGGVRLDHTPSGR